MSRPNLRTDLKLATIKGQVDVVNRYGTTEFKLDKASSSGIQRIVSESGAITVMGPAAVLEKASVRAYSQCGTARTNLSSSILEDVSFSTGRPQMGWHGFTPPSREPFNMEKFDRPVAALEGRERSAGLDVISRAGEISIMTNRKADVSRPPKKK
jgi:hypothetical protein